MIFFACFYFVFNSKKLFIKCYRFFLFNLFYLRNIFLHSFISHYINLHYLLDDTKVKLLEGKPQINKVFFLVDCLIKKNFLFAAFLNHRFCTFFVLWYFCLANQRRTAIDHAVFIPCALICTNILCLPSRFSLPSFVLFLQGCGSGFGRIPDPGLCTPNDIRYLKYY